MKSAVLGAAAIVLLGCGDFPDPLLPLSGTWTLTSTPHSPLDPRTLNLDEQVNEGVSGTGTAMGVDAPLTLSVSGGMAMPAVDLSFRYQSGATGSFAGRLDPDGRLIGQVQFDSAAGGGLDSLTYTRR
jgi:hypothetical protein